MAQNIIYLEFSSKSMRFLLYFPIAAIRPFGQIPEIYLLTFRLINSLNTVARKGKDIMTSVFFTLLSTLTFFEG